MSESTDGKPRKPWAIEQLNDYAWLAVILLSSLLLYSALWTLTLEVRTRQLTAEVNGLGDEVGRLEARTRQLEENLYQQVAPRVRRLEDHPGDRTHLDCDYYGRCRVPR